MSQARVWKVLTFISIFYSAGLLGHLLNHALKTPSLALSRSVKPRSQFKSHSHSWSLTPYGSEVTLTPSLLLSSISCVRSQGDERNDRKWKVQKWDWDPVHRSRWLDMVTSHGQRGQIDLIWLDLEYSRVPPQPHPHPITSSPEFEHSHSCLFCTIRYFRKLSKRLGPSSITLPSRSFTDTGQFCFTHLAQADINQPGQHDKTVAPDGFVLMQMNPGPFYHWYLHLRVTHWYTNPFLKGKN